MYRNYFSQKAVGARSLETAYYALLGLQLQKDQIYLEDPAKSIITVDASQNTLTYDILTVPGQHISGPPVKSINKALVLQISNNKVVLDAKGRVGISQDNTQLVVELTPQEVLELKWTSHLIIFEF